MCDDGPPVKYKKTVAKILFRNFIFNQSINQSINQLISQVTNQGKNQ
jgi:hypothetical protein